MTITIISRTKRGTETGLKLHRHLPGSTLHAPEKFCAGSEAAPYSGPVKAVLLDAFAGSEALVCIMAAGIVVRSLAPALVSKHSDPAVVVLDEGGEFAISLLSGHKGGANELARQVAALLGGTPVLTTASDSQQLPALDLLGRRFGWQLAADSDMTGVIAALVNGEPLGVMQDFGDDSWLPQPLPPHLTRYPTLQALTAAQPAAALLITARPVPDSLRATIPAVAIYHPKDDGDQKKLLNPMSFRAKNEREISQTHS